MLAKIPVNIIFLVNFLLQIKTVVGSCPFEISDTYYVSSANCDDEFIYIEAFEDAPENECLFQITDSSWRIGECEEIYSGTGCFGFAEVGDAELARGERTCPDFLIDSNGKDYLGQFVFLDVNEYYPQPDGIDYIHPMNIEEENEGILLEFGYLDEDYGETEVITFEELFDAETSAIFEINENTQTSTPLLKQYQLIAKQPLDFESDNFFSLRVNFSSFDQRDTYKTSTQVFNIRVIDISDNPPFFTNTPASVEFQETNQTGVFVFQAHAQDGDFMVDNEIYYSIESGNDDGYFSIDEQTGEVVTTKEIDREFLLTENNLVFALGIQALEIEDAGGALPQATEDNSALHVTNVIITDVNDQIPHFNVDLIEETITEFDSSTGEVILDVYVTVSDLDEGNSGAYDLASDNEYVTVSPSTGSGQTDLTVTLKSSDYFDYEIQGDAPVVVTITATERADSTHKDSFQLEINLLDANDNYPIFEQIQYSEDVNETIEVNSPVITITATDADVSSSYNADSIVYTISGCNEFAIDAGSGIVTTAAPLDYESDQQISCTITASDMGGNSADSLDSSTTLIVDIEDVNDEQPRIVADTQEPVELLENISAGSLVSEVFALDQDTTADLNVFLQIVPDDSITNSWFSLFEIETVECGSDDSFCFYGEIQVTGELDREYLDEVTLQVVAEDTMTQVGEGQAIETIAVNILDVNDEEPYFLEDYSDLEVTEEEDNGTLVIIIEADDDDLNDVLTFSVNDDTYLDINSTGALYVNNRIDREEVAEFTIEVSVEDSASHVSTVTINFQVNDINDNSPVFDDVICDTPYEVFENSEEGTFITTVVATDEDQGVHQDITYQFDNQGISNAPFTIDSETGNITVFYEPGEVLDREIQNEWALLVFAYDSCGTNEDIACQINNDICRINITVLDQNDNAPGSIVPNSISSDESCKEGELISPEQLYSVDPDEVNSPNSKVTFEAARMWNTTGVATTVLEDILVEAVSYNDTYDGIYQYYCQLYALTNFTHLFGTYIVEIETSDFGDPIKSSLSNVTLRIEDYNDFFPTFYFDNCQDQTIVQRENDTEMVYEPLKCSDQLQPLTIYVYDNDVQASSEVFLRIDYSKSTANSGEGNQLSAFEVREEANNVYSVIATEVLDRERGSEYNLTLEATDNGVPSLTSYSWVFIIVTDADEYPPTFCETEELPCSDTLSIYENTMTGAFFQPATDRDNELIDAGDDVQVIGYRLINEGPFPAFYIPNATLNYLAPLTPLDREAQDIYGGIEVEAFSYDSTSTVSPTAASILYITVTVLDVNDNAPYYPEEAIYGDYLDTGNEGDRVAVFKFEDADLNEILTYYLLDDYFWSDGVSNFDDPFAIRQEPGNNSAEIYLNMDPEGTTGYCTFTVVAEDRDRVHSNSTTAVVFVVTREFIVSFYFDNTLEQVRVSKDEIEDILGFAFNATCLIDTISAATNEDNQELTSLTEVETHFFREVEQRSSQLELVSTEEIERMASDSRVAKILLESFSRIGLSLVRIGESGATIDQNDEEDTIRALKIALLCVTLFLLLLILLVVLTNYVKTQKLKRELKVAKIPIYGDATMSSPPGGDYSYGGGTISLPGTNRFASGVSNPIFRSEFFSRYTQEKDAHSTISGDSELVGVEDIPAFDVIKITPNATGTKEGGSLTQSAVPRLGSGTDKNQDDAISLSNSNFVNTQSKLQLQEPDEPKAQDGDKAKVMLMKTPFLV